MHGMRMKSHSRQVNFNPKKLNRGNGGGYGNRAFYQTQAVPKEETKAEVPTASKKPPLKLASPAKPSRRKAK